MSTLISPDDLREHFETDLDDLALQRLINDADELITSRYGAHAVDGDIEEEVLGSGSLLFLSRPAAAIIGIKEYRATLLGGAEVEEILDTNDWRLSYRRQLQRLISGTNPWDYWGHRVLVTYTPQADNHQRTRVEIDLCRLAATYSGAIKSERAGDYSVTFAGGTTDAYLAYQREREAILKSLSNGRALFV